MFESAVEAKKKTNILVAGARKPINSRYFIELHVEKSQETARPVLDQMRRHKALEFTQIVSEWLGEHGMANDVASISVTAMGQVMIVCSNRVIDQIREQDVWGIAHIRSSDQFSKLASRARN